MRFGGVRFGVGPGHVAVLALGTGAFLLMLSALLPLYVYPSGARHPLEITSATRMRAENASYFDTAYLRRRTGMTIRADVQLRGDPSAGTGTRAVWTEFASLTAGGGDRIGYRERRFAFDRRTGETVNCCGEYVGTDQQVRQAGLAVRWPVGAVRRDYPLYDPQLKRSFPAGFTGTEVLYGLPVDRYLQRIPPTKVAALPEALPGSVLGLRSGRRFGVTHYAAVTRVIWVEPRSGLPVRMTEDRRETLRTADGVDRITSLQARLVTEDDDVRAQVATAERFATWATLVLDVLPPGLQIAAVPLFALGAFLLHRARRKGSAPAQHQQEVPGDDLPEPGDAYDGHGPPRVVAGDRGDDVDG